MAAIIPPLSSLLVKMITQLSDNKGSGYDAEGDV